MNEKQKPKGRHFYIPAHIVAHVEQYADENGLPVSKAITEILSGHFRRPESGEDQLASRKDIKRILKKIELTNMILEPALLELLESSGHSRFESNEVPEKQQLGRSIKRKYAELFRDMRDIL